MPHPAWLPVFPEMGHPPPSLGNLSKFFTTLIVYIYKKKPTLFLIFNLRTSPQPWPVVTVCAKRFFAILFYRSPVGTEGPQSCLPGAFSCLNNLSSLSLCSQEVLQPSHHLFGPPQCCTSFFFWWGPWNGNIYWKRWSVIRFTDADVYVRMAFHSLTVEENEEIPERFLS